MIFKGNTKLTPALTDLLDDTTPKNNKTYSSEKIQTLLKTDAVTALFKINKETLQEKIPSSLVWNTATGFGHQTFFTVNINDFTKIGTIEESDYNKYTFVLVCEPGNQNSVTAITKTVSQVALSYFRLNNNYLYTQYYGYNETIITINVFLTGICGLPQSFLDGTSDLIFTGSWKGITNYFPTITIDTEVLKDNMCDMVIYAFPKGLL